MCAISGLISKGIMNSCNEIYSMTDVMLHRGPDAQGFAAFEGNEIKPLKKGQQGVLARVLLGFNRLSIRDVSENGMQPMIGCNGKVAIIFNGEIYNAEEMKEELQDCFFHSTSDTEVILLYYLKYGLEKCIKKLNGMFAIYLLDGRYNISYLVRDRIGIKPLYYTYLQNETLSFASEIKAFLANKLFTPKLDIAAVREYFTFGDPINRTLIENVKEVLPGSYIEINLNTLETEEKIYFDINRLYHETKTSDRELLDKYSNHISSVIKRQLVSDVPVGVQCSGGVDSSLVAYYTSKIFPKTFRGGVSIIPEDIKYSEEKYIDIITDKTGIDIHKFTLNDMYVINSIPKAVWHYESIITYHNVIALLRLSQMAKQYVSVLLSGEGADELFAGYTWYEDGILASEVINIRKKLYRKKLLDSICGTVRGLDGAETFGDFVISCTDTIPNDISSLILSPIGYSREKEYYKRLAFFNSLDGSDFDKQVKYEVNTRLRALLIRQDKACMAFSVENRVPFLDNEMIELSFQSSQNDLIKNRPTEEDANDSRTYHFLKGKYPLKRLSESIFGSHFAFRRKMGFPLPFHNYMKNPIFQEYAMEEILPSMKERGIINSDYIKKSLKKVSDKSDRWQYAGLWKALTFEIFCRQFIDKEGFN